MRLFPLEERRGEWNCMGTGGGGGGGRNIAVDTFRGYAKGKRGRWMTVHCTRDGPATGNGLISQASQF